MAMKILEPKNQNMRLLVKWSWWRNFWIRNQNSHKNTWECSLATQQDFIIIYYYHQACQWDLAWSRSLTGSQKYKEKSTGLKTSLGPVQSYAEDRLAQSHNSAYGLSFFLKKKDQINYCLVRVEMPSIYWFWKKTQSYFWFSEREVAFFFFFFHLDQILTEEQQQHKQCVPLWIKKKITNYIKNYFSYFRLKRKKTSTLTAFIEQF